MTEPSALSFIAKAYLYLSHTKAEIDTKVLKAFAYGHFGHEEFEAATKDHEKEVANVIIPMIDNASTASPVQKIALPKANRLIWNAIGVLETTDAKKAKSLQMLVQEDMRQPWERDSDEMAEMVGG